MRTDCYTHILLTIEALLIGTIANKNIILLEHGKDQLIGILRRKNLAQEMNVPLLAQIPLVQGICEKGDAGTPSALDENTVTGQAFLALAQSVVTVVNRRNKELEKTKIVKTK